MYQLVFDTAGEVLVEAVTEVGCRVAGAAHQLLELRGILGDRFTSLPEGAECVLGIHRFIGGFKPRAEVGFESGPAVLERPISGDFFEVWGGPDGRFILKEG